MTKAKHHRDNPPIQGDGKIEAPRDPDLDGLGFSQYECSLVRHDPRLPSTVCFSMAVDPLFDDRTTLVLTAAERLRLYEIGGQADDLAEYDRATERDESVWLYLRAVNRQTARNAARHEPEPTHKFCRACRTDVPVADYTRDRSLHDGLAPLCRTCKRAYERQRDQICRRAGLPIRPSRRTQP